MATSINDILKILNSAFSVGQKPAPPIPPFLLLTGVNLRPGMSGRNLAANIISRLESDAGIQMGDIFGDDNNAMSNAVLIISEEIIKHIQENAKVSNIILPGSIQVTAIGSAGPIPVVVQGANTTLTQSNGIVQ
jgi:hypothetical protein